MAKSIDVSDVNIYYGDFLAGGGVNMPIRARSVTAFIGPSGCGKSTFLRSLNRMHEVIPGARVDGKIMIDGTDLYGSDVDPVEVRQQIGMVFQRPNPFPTMSIYQNCIARAIAVEPQVLLMDEPCSALDPISTSAIEDLIHELRETYTIVIVTHNMQQAARVSDRTAFFNLAGVGKPGQLVEMDDTEKIFANPSDKRTEDYISGRFG